MPDPRLPAEVRELLKRAKFFDHSRIVNDLVAALERAYALPERDELAAVLCNAVGTVTWEDAKKYARLSAIDGSPNTWPYLLQAYRKQADALLARWPALGAKPLTSEASSENDSVVSRSAASNT